MPSRLLQVVELHCLFCMFKCCADVSKPETARGEHVVGLGERRRVFGQRPKIEGMPIEREEEIAKGLVKDIFAAPPDQHVVVVDEVGIAEE